MEASLTGRNVGLDKHLSRRHEVCVGVRVEPRSGYHELHDGGITLGRVKLISRFRSASLVFWIYVGSVPVDITAVDKTTYDGNASISQSFCSGIPALLLHGKKCCIVEPLTLRRCEIVGVSARVEDTDGFGPVVILVGRVIRARSCAIFYGANVSTRTNGTIPTKRNV